MKKPNVCNVSTNLSLQKVLGGKLKPEGLTTPKKIKWMNKPKKKQTETGEQTKHITKIK